MRTLNDKCPACETPVYRRPCERIRFCSSKCFESKRYRKKNTSCQQCGVLLKPGAGSSAKFCSKSCSNRSRVGIKYDGTQPKSKTVNHSRARVALIERDGDECKICGLCPVWMGKPLRLQIDHVDGDRSSNGLDNLRLLCPNCHTQTETFGNRKVRCEEAKRNGDVPEW